jgi:DNA-binding MarR family transcriptional regulator
MTADAAHIWQGMKTLVLDRHDVKAEVCEKLQMSFVRVKALRLVAGKSVPLRSLAEALGTDPPYVTVIVDDLAARGFVTREPHPADRRSRLVTITPAGATAAAVAEHILATPPEPMLHLSPADLSTLDRIMTALLDRPASRSGPG